MGVCYRPPNSYLDLFINFVEGSSSSLGSGDVAVCVDFNLDLLSLNENSSAQVYYNAMNAV